MIKPFLFLAIFTIPISIDYTLFEPSKEAFSGWAAGALVTLSDLIFLSVLVAWRLETLHLPRPRARVIFWRPIAFFMAACLISIPGSIWSVFGYIAVFQLGKLVLIYYGISRIVLQDRRYIPTACYALIAALCFQASLATVQFFTQDYYSFLRTGSQAALTRFGDLIRSHGTVGVPNALAAFIIPVLLLVVVKLLLDDQANRPAYFFILCIGSAALLFTFSRSGWCTFALSALALFVRSARIKRPPPYVYPLLAIGVAVVLLSGIVDSRISSDDQGSAQDRWYLMLIAVRMIRAHFVTGVGINNYWFAMNHYIPPDYGWSFVYVVHNVFLLVFAETGIIGFIAVILLFATPVIRLYPLAQSSTDEQGRLALWIVTSIVGIAFLNLVEFTWASSIICSFYFLMLGLGDALVNAAEGAAKE
jgi:O-antigen ligase